MVVDERLEMMGGKRSGAAPHNMLMPKALAWDLGLAERTTVSVIFLLLGMLTTSCLLCTAGGSCDGDFFFFFFWVHRAWGKPQNHCECLGQPADVPLRVIIWGLNLSLEGASCYLVHLGHYTKAVGGVDHGSRPLGAAEGTDDMRVSHADFRLPRREEEGGV